MANMLKGNNLDDLINRCKAGESLYSIAKSVGVCDRTVMEHFHRCGFRVNEWRTTSILERCRPLHADHVAGESVLSISKRTGIPRKTITQAFAALGLTWRNQSEGMFVRQSKMKPEERRALASAAHAAVRGRKVGVPEHVKRSATRSRRVGKFEREIIEELRSRGVDCDHQHPFGPYNLDIWLTESRIAVEVYRAHPCRKLMAKLHKRTEYILDSGASQATVQFSYPKGTPNLGAVCDQIIAFSDFCRRHHPAGGQHGVIRGNGKLSATSSHETNGRPLVARLDAGPEAA